MSSDSTKGEHSSRIQQKSDPQQVSDRIFFIDASNQSLLTIPADILALRELEEVHLENNLIAEIPKDIQHLRMIRVLYLNKNKLKNLCPEMGKLSNLEGLDLSDNPLEASSLPVLSGIRQLRELRLYHTDLADIPVVICKLLHHLELLGLAGNRLKSLPKEIVNQTKLREIHLKHNQLQRSLWSCVVSTTWRSSTWMRTSSRSSRKRREPDEAEEVLRVLQQPGCSPGVAGPVHQAISAGPLLQPPPHPPAHLGRALADDGGGPEWEPPGKDAVPPLQVDLAVPSLPAQTGLRVLRRSFRRLVNLRFLDLSQNFLEHCPLQICSLKNLEVLALDDNKIRQLPSDFGLLSKLKILGLTGNQFSSFPKEILSLASLEKLYIGQDEGAKLTHLPECIKRLENLKELYIENNHLEYLPVSLGSMPNLEILDCHCNLIKQLPDAICQAQALKELQFEDNLITYLPENLDSLVNLKVLTLTGNPMEEPPMSVCTKGTEAIWEYLKERRNMKELATKIQAWWRGMMVRKGLGKFEELLKLQKKGKNSPKDKKGKKDVKGKPFLASLNKGAPNIYSEK
ncbi:LOW QUALITY PROTEIN: leucine-rich repeat and IQ domain-containing protein 4 [Oryx dammah]|uniref:LOW QUALITY PROTEIN: leucine-rich repeat and IQ domain-containing protein 4 n=1 Tax=Oryx dammah TaxID=59534 RepID=UPI001A9B8A98|nr:LOW QUALITY PROTEIN: leucine-rich repeat and IQ domain-containing protein 4 [Oryx dammah]